MEGFYGFLGFLGLAILIGLLPVILTAISKYIRGPLTWPGDKSMSELTAEMDDYFAKLNEESNKARVRRLRKAKLLRRPKYRDYVDPFLNNFV